jgi:hypothetical protein
MIIQLAHHANLIAGKNLLTMKQAFANHAVGQVMLMIISTNVFTTVRKIDTKTTKINFALKNNFVE